MRARCEIASFPPVLSANPYQRLLYEGLGRHGYRVAAATRLGVRELIRDRRRVGILHFHWPQGYYRESRGPPWVRRLLSSPRLALFAARLAVARALGYRIVWTVHQVIPHEPLGRRLDLQAARVLAAMSHVLLAHDEATRRSAMAKLGRAGRRVHVVAHGSYIDAYPPGRGRASARASLGLAQSAVVFLAFGTIRAYKETGLVLDAFRRVTSPGAVLIVAGPPHDDAAAATVRAAAERDPRIRSLLGFVDESEVSDLFAACDAAVVARGDGGTSGAVILAMSLGRPVVAAQVPNYEELLGDGAGWFFVPGDAASLAAAMESVCRDLAGARARGIEARRRAALMRWDESAAAVAALLDDRDRHDDRDRVTAPG